MQTGRDYESAGADTAELAKYLGASGARKVSNRRQGVGRLLLAAENPSPVPRLSLTLNIAESVHYLAKRLSYQA